MKKKTKLSTPEWILEGYNSKKEYENDKGIILEKPKKEFEKKPKTKKTKKQVDSEKIFKIKKCPECGNKEIKVVVGEKVKGLWKCNKCNWKGKKIDTEEVSEEEFIKYLENKENGK
jgi:ribosomal protein L37AE/L43A